MTGMKVWAAGGFRPDGVWRKAQRAVNGFAQRLAGTPPAEVAQPAAAPSEPLRHRIDLFRYLDGRLSLAGSAETATRPIVLLTLRLPDGARFPIPFTPTPTGIAFTARIDVERQPPEIAQAHIEAVLMDGSVIDITGPGQPVDDPAHALTDRFLRMLGERGSGRILEIGSRARSGIVRRSYVPETWSYEGLDIVAGPNVDNVGDAHQLSRLYPPASFDAVMAFSVLEHLLMPWKVVVELNRVLRPGAIGLFTTHQCWPLHEQPWDFWRFSDTSWQALLNPATGFEIVDAQMGERAHVVASKMHPATAFGGADAALASNVLFRKVGETDLAWPVELSDVIATSYPSA
jgi:SAM-dependent methyltransferase